MNDVSIATHNYSLAELAQRLVGRFVQEKCQKILLTRHKNTQEAFYQHEINQSNLGYNNC